ncbi:PREDICTED: uncharacterized protein LOC105116088 [Populus euphratica]|uniref:ATP-dependent DNA helicase n=1 Tax=Populus euphratica TaxID=75702 RepID=A0AAJ6TIR4_POPEU|nr:PREDICTED: uncharacterized protein LOC105116088 [Populus euphratica]
MASHTVRDDEALMNNRFSFEALDRSLCDVLKDVGGRCPDEHFGGKSILLSGDFCQIILVISGGTKMFWLEVHVNCKSKGHLEIYLNANSVEAPFGHGNNTELLYPIEFINQLEFNGVPSHALALKLETPVMLLGNLNPAAGLYNGTRLIITELAK